MTQVDEPTPAGPPPPEPVDVSGDPALPAKIRRLVDEQPYGVLCTQGGGEPYGSLIAFAVAADLASAVFATPVATRKYRLLTECDRVSLVIDNRSRQHDNLMQIEAVTVTGRAHEVKRGTEHDALAALLGRRHPDLRMFVASASAALFRIDISRYYHVSRFQEVGQWVPPAASSI